MTSGIVIFSSKTHFLEVEMSVGHFRPFEELNLAYTREQIKQKKGQFKGWYGTTAHP